MIDYIMTTNDLVSVDFFRLNDVLLKMVRAGQLTTSEREDLLYKSGLIKLEDGRWRESETTILTLVNE
jgi:hypothetical protein